jgi:hypothetical protein
MNREYDILKNLLEKCELVDKEVLNKPNEEKFNYQEGRKIEKLDEFKNNMIDIKNSLNKRSVML